MHDQPRMAFSNLRCVKNQQECDVECEHDGTSTSIQKQKVRKYSDIESRPEHTIF